MLVTSNILDPIHDTLSPAVFDNPGSDKPVLKDQHRKWIRKTIYKVLEDAGYTHIDQWLTLVLTGSLTTYQYDKGSDCDISLFVDAKHFPEWSRAEMIGLMIGKVEGRILPGTHYPMQCFVVPPEVKREDLYQPGLRSGYDLSTSSWIVPPERDRSLDVKKQLPEFYAYALEQADKMESLLRYEPDKAVLFWHQIHKRRRDDQKAGKGDYAASNVIYKFLANRGLFDKISEASGEYIAKTASEPIHDEHKFHRLDQRAIDLAARHLGIKSPVHVVQVGGTCGRYHGTDAQGKHQISVVGWLKPESASKQIWHELAHAHQAEHGEDVMNIPTTDDVDYEKYRNHPLEAEANQWHDLHPFAVALPPIKEGSHREAAPGFRPQIAKFIYDPVNHVGLVGEMGRAEGENYSHNQLAQQLRAKVPDMNLKSLCFGDIGRTGVAQVFGRPRINGPKSDINPYQATYEACEFVEKAVPGAKVRNKPEKLSDKWGQADPTVLYVGEPPVVDSKTDTPIEQPQSWTF